MITNNNTAILRSIFIMLVQQVTGLLEFIVSGPKNFRIGLRGFANDFTAYQNLQNFEKAIIVNDTPEITSRESGFNPYIHFSGNAFKFLSEFHYETTAVVR